jgi:long-chain acyl-CoA synthetase
MKCMTLTGQVAHFAALHPDQTALRVKRLGIWQSITWANYRDEMTACGLVLSAWGINAADHVAILSDNRPEWLFADLGIQLLEARSVGIYQTNPPADVGYILKHAQCRVVFAEDQEQVDKLLDEHGGAEAVEHIVVFDERGTSQYEDPRLMSWTEFRAHGVKLLKEHTTWLETRLAQSDPETPTMVVYTSGTTGRPKGALLSPANATRLNPTLAKALGLSSKDQVLSYLPLCHVAEKIFSLFLPLSVGAVVHFGESIETIRADLKEVSPTVFLGVPRIWEKMYASMVLKMKDASWLKRMLFDWAYKTGKAVEHKRRNAGANLWDSARYWMADFLVFRPLQEKFGLRRCVLPISGAAPIAPDLLESFHGIGIRILEGFGMTECSGVSHLNPKGAARIGTVGKALTGCECRTAPDGEVLIRGPHVFKGYLHNETATADTIDGDGWLHTGDLGHIDELGYLSITGRKKEIIITAGGKNISPEKIENAMKMSPYIKETVAIGDQRKFISALIQIDADAVGDWAVRRDLTYTSFSDLSQKPAVYDLIKSAVHQNNERLARVEQVRAFKLFDKELHQDDGELTATQKVRRRAITERYAPLIESIYGGGS